jgi:hypothetical protein
MNAGEKQTNRLTAEVKRVNKHKLESIVIIAHETRSGSLAIPATPSQITNTASTSRVSHPLISETYKYPATAINSDEADGVSSAPAREGKNPFVSEVP